MNRISRGRLQPRHRCEGRHPVTLLAHLGIGLTFLEHRRLAGDVRNCFGPTFKVNRIIGQESTRVMLDHIRQPIAQRKGPIRQPHFKGVPLPTRRNCGGKNYFLARLQRLIAHARATAISRELAPPPIHEDLFTAGWRRGRIPKVGER